MRVALLGGGQLARMIGLAGYNFGLSFRCLDPARRSCAADVMEQLSGAWDDPGQIKRLLDGADCVTFETENVSLQALDLIAASQTVCYPPYEALRVTQDRLLEKQFLRDSGLETAPFAAPQHKEELEKSGLELGFPLILKTRRMGYDGKGQRLVKNHIELLAAWDELGGKDLILEGFVRFEGEGSLLAVRDARGQCLFYPIVKNEHRQGVLYQSRPWAGFPATARRSLEQQMKFLMERFQYRGVLALEFFLCGERVIANELAPRVHNSGHWTQHAAITSQFENHLRAICGWDLGATEALCDFRMINFLGRVPPVRELMALPGLKVSDYRKEPAPGRKVGHATLLKIGDEAAFEEAWKRLEDLVSPHSDS